MKYLCAAVNSWLRAVTAVKNLQLPIIDGYDRRNGPRITSVGRDGECAEVSIVLYAG